MTTPEDDGINRDLANGLAQLMSDLSESCWCASWLIGAETDIWQLVSGTRDTWGMCHRDRITDELATIRALSEAAGCWIAWDDALGSDRRVPLAEWVASQEDGQ